MRRHTVNGLLQTHDTYRELTKFKPQKKTKTNPTNKIIPKVLRIQFRERISHWLEHTGSFISNAFWRSHAPVPSKNSVLSTHGVPMVRRNIPGVNHHMRQKGWKGNQNAHISRAVCGGHAVNLGGFHFHRIEHMIILRKSHVLILLEKPVKTADVEDYFIIFIYAILVNAGIKLSINIF